MKNIIRKLLKENYHLNESEDDFDWVDTSIVDDLDLSPGLVLYKFGDNQAVRDYIAKAVCDDLSDLKYENGRIMLYVDGWCEFKGFFYDGSSDRYVNKYLFEKIMCQEDYFELYDNVVRRVEWKEVIWDNFIMHNPKLINLVLEYIKNHLVVPDNYNPKQLDIFGELPKKRRVVKINGRVLDMDYFNELKSDLDYLGVLIHEDEDGEFTDIVNELWWSYESAYNTFVYDSIYSSCINSITQEFGPVKRVDDYLVFDVTEVFWSTILPYFSDCWYNCRYKDEAYEDLSKLDELCDECSNISNEYSDFISFIKNYNDVEISTRFDDSPSYNEIQKYFEEEVEGRL
jgi:hypothetical protein